jgi:CubicO group peptidase (beta-lactamase class C family)
MFGSKMKWRVDRPILMLSAVALLAVPAAAERPVEGRRTQAELSPIKVLESLGPGPLPPQQPRTIPSSDWLKSTDLENAIDSCVQSNMARLNAPGAAVAVILDGEMLYESGYGVKQRGGDMDVDPETVFRIGSVTKMMTAAAVLQQVELGRVDLDAPVTDYIPEFAVGGRWPADRIKVWHTLTHTTSFPDWINDVVRTGDEALSRWAVDQGGVELHAPPGSYWNYSNPNFMLAGLVAERASGTPYRDLFKESLWEPAGMNSTTFDPAEVIQRGNYSQGHYYDPVELQSYVVGPSDNDYWAAGPAGWAFSTVGDLARWALLLMDGGGPVLSPYSAATMQDPHQWMNYRPDQYYGYGVMVEEYQGLDVRQHGGNVAGYGTYLLWVPERRFAVALLTNVTSSLTTAAYCIVDQVLEPDPVDPPDLSTDPSSWRRYGGNYLITDYQGESTSATVYLDGDQLMASIIDPEDPDTPVITPLVQVFLDTFLYDSNGDGVVNNNDALNDLTFCSRPGKPGFVMWMRNRYAVGQRQFTPRSGARLVLP